MRVMGGTAMATLDDILEPGPAERLATGFVFTEGPSWHPDGFYYFVDIRRSLLFRLRPGQTPEVVRSETGEGNGTTFDLQGRLVICEGGNRRVARIADDGSAAVLMDRYQGKRINRPNDVVCRSDGSIWFTDPGLRIPLADKELVHSGVYRIMPDGTKRLVAEYIHAIELDAEGDMVRRRIFADMSSEETDGVPDGMKVDVEGRVFCTGPGGTWVFAADGTRIGIVRTPEIPANLCFGGADLKTIFFTARTSVYTMRAKVAGQPHPWYRVRAR
jgi:gluconolactonase